MKLLCQLKVLVSILGIKVSEQLFAGYKTGKDSSSITGSAQVAEGDQIMDTLLI